MKRTHCAAVDLGATSGRVIVGSFSDEGLSLNEVHRFPNGFHTLGKYAYWDLGGLFDEVQKGLLEAKRVFPDLASCGVDTWGVDHVLLDKTGRLCFPVHAYRDERTEPFLKAMKSDGGDKSLYDWTGLPPINYNTSLQLAETVNAFPHLRDVVDRVLFLPDYFNYLLSGRMANEVSIASTGQILDVSTGSLSLDALDYFKIPHQWFEEPTKAGCLLGKIQGIPALEDVEVVLAPGHDTSCAFEAIPQSGQSLLVSAGTWLLTGGLTRQPATGEEAFSLGVSNERDGQGNPRPNKILLGLWLLEKTFDSFSSVPESAAEWDALIEAAEDEPEAVLCIDTRDESLFNPSDMRAAIDANLVRQGGVPPKSLAGYTRLICDSLGKSVATTAHKFSQMTGTDFDSISIVGGGSKNRLLCQRIADLSGWPVSSYNLEGTTVGNIGYQLLGLGVIPSMQAFREAIGPKLSPQTYSPRV